MMPAAPKMTQQSLLPGLDSPLRGEVKNERHTMLHSFFALLPGRTEPITYREGNVQIEVKGTSAGIATVTDKEFLIYISSLIAEKLDRGELVAQTFTFTAHDFFRVSGRSTGNRSYELLKGSLERLQGTQIMTNIKTGGQGSRSWFSWLNAATIETMVRKDGKEVWKRITVELCDWLWRAIVKDRHFLTNEAGYFRLPAMERRLYEIAHAELDTQSSVAIPLNTLRQRMAATTNLKAYRYKLAKMFESGVLPGFAFAIACRTIDGRFVEPGKRISLDQLYVTITRQPGLPMIDPMLTRSVEQGDDSMT
jgi:hypothetical protein